MPASTKRDRQRPPRVFENYVLTRVISKNAGITDVPWQKFKKLDDSTVVSGSFSPYSDAGAVSTPLDIGFTFNFDGINYNKFVVASAGYIVLLDPTFNKFAPLDIFGSDLSETNSIINAGFLKSHVLLAPWFDALKLLDNDPYNGFIETATSDRVQQGLNYLPPVRSYNPTKCGVSFCNDKCDAGNRLLIRWGVYSTLTNIVGITGNTSVLYFETVIYENGNIEYRYVSKEEIGRAFDAVQAEGACIGIFMSGSTSQRRFRDFSLGINYRDKDRTSYKFGGAVYSSSYVDVATSLNNLPGTSASYSLNLKTFDNWPAGLLFGSTFSFQAPQNKRKILPSLEITKQRALFDEQQSFDDRRTVLYGNRSIVNFPTTLQRFYGDTEDSVTQRQDLFVGDFDVTASISKTASEQYVEKFEQKTNQTFSEQNLFDQDYPLDSFFTTGSSIDLFGNNLKQQLKSKTQFRLLLDIGHQTQMLSSSNIYYYNSKQKGWNVPRNSVSSSISGTLLAGTPPPTSFSINASNSDICDPLAYWAGNNSPEDTRGFGPIGNRVSSGSTQGIPLNVQSDPFLEGVVFNRKIDALTHKFEKSVQNNPDYIPTADETFIVPNNEPFLIEKAVFKLPISMGDGWFKDMTSANIPFFSGSIGTLVDGEITNISGTFDFGGPGITISLFSVKQNGPFTKFDLIMTATITHVFDNTSQVQFFKDPGMTYHCIRPIGFKAHAATPGAVVTPSSSSVAGFNYSGSVTVRSVAAVTNGLVLNQTYDYTLASASAATNITSLLTMPSISLTTFYDATANKQQGSFIYQVSPFGRSASGFNPSGNSVFGKELCSTNGDVVSNPFYVSSSLSSFPQFMKDNLNSASFRALAVAAIPQQVTLASPYLVFPGDKLVLAISKTRPSMYKVSTALGVSYSGTIGHDVTLNSGSVKITLYGSSLKENQEAHLSTNKTNTEAIYTVIGDEPTLDQFDVSYREMFYGTTQDDFITGSLVSKVGTSVVTGSRGKIFSKLNASTQPVVSDGSQTVSQMLTNWTELVGTENLFQAPSNERFYDSMLPAISDVLKIDGTNPVLLSLGGVTAGVFTLNSDLLASFYPTANISNNNWAFAFPFEPHYASLSRHQAVDSSFIVKSDGTQQINPVTIKPLVFFGGKFPTRVSDTTFIMTTDNSVKTLSALTASTNNVVMNVSDLSRVLYGFGDMNSIYFSPTTNTYNGSNHFVSFRALRTSVLIDSVYSPVVRGWKYGIIHGLPTFSRAVFRRNKFGQLRDMLEQRIDTKFYITPDENAQKDQNKTNIGTSVVTVKFIDPFTGNITPAENTQSQNLSFEATSSLPYFDGQTRNRPAINENNLNVSTFVF